MPSSGVELVDIAFGILGRTALRFGNSLEENWGRPKELAILATLLVHPGRTVTVRSLIEWAWPEESVLPGNPASALHTHAARLRKSLRRLSPVPLLTTTNGGYRLDVDRSLIDYYRFRELIVEARALARVNDHEQAAAVASQAISLWRGDPLEDIHSEPADAWRWRVVHDEWLPAQIILLEALVASGQFDQALVRLNELQAEHPLDLNLVKLRMSVLQGMSRSAESWAYYVNIQRRLRAEVDDLAAEHLRRHHERLANAMEHQSHPATRAQLTPHQVPQDVSQFVGRTDVLAALDATMDAMVGEPDAAQAPSGIVVVHGMPGVGKTTVVVHWAHRVKNKFPDGDFYVNLHGFSRSPAIPHTTVIDDFLIALGHPPDKSQSAREKELLLNQLFIGKRALVILDNARDTAHVERLLPLLASCLIIVTSRQRMTQLSRAGARQILVVPMTSAEGAELLATRLDHDRVAPATGTQISALCNGLPLAIAVLAHHIADRPAPTLATFVQRLTAHELITDIGHDGDDPTSLRTFFEWSYLALGAPERRLFRLLGLHPGADVSTDAACAYDDRSPAESRRSLSILVGAHLLEQPQTFDRYQFHDLIREFAADCAELDEPATERVAADLRMVEYYLDTSNKAYKLLYPSLLAAPELSLSHQFEYMSFPDKEYARSWFNQERTTLSAVIHYSKESGNHEHAWRLADIVSAVFERYGYYTDSRAIRQVAVFSATAAGNAEAVASSHAGLGMTLKILGEHTEARKSFELALRYAEETNNHRGQGSTLYQLSQLELSRGDLPGAAALLRRCLQVNRNTDDHEGLAWAHCGLGEVLRLLDQHDVALLHLHQAQFHAARSDDVAAQATTLAETGSVFRDRGDYANAATYCQQALTVLDRAPIPDLAISIRVCQALAEVVTKLGQGDEAYEYARRALEISRRTHNVTAEARSWDVLCTLYFERGDLHDAAIAGQQASDLYDRIGNHRRATALRAMLRQTQAGESGVPDARTTDPHERLRDTDPRRISGN